MPVFSVTTCFGLISSSGILLVKLLLHILYYSRVQDITQVIPETAMGWILLIGVGFLSFICQVLLTAASKIETASVVALLRTAFSIIFAFALQVVIFKVCSLYDYVYIYTHPSTNGNRSYTDAHI